MLRHFEIAYIRSFTTPQKLQLANPNGARGSGYNALVGKNNSGKSTIIKLMREMFSVQDTITIGQEARHDPNRPHLAIEWFGNNATLRAEINAEGTGGYLRKVGDDYKDGAAKLKYIPSRRAFSSQFQSTSQMNAAAYEASDYVNRRSIQNYFDSNLSNSLARILTDPITGPRICEILARIDRRVANLDADNVGDRDVIRFRSASGRWHLVSDTGDGIINLIRIIHAIVTSAEGYCIVIDEPELSLHPQFQRALYELLVETSATHQIIVVTHSPHFVSWKDIATEGNLCRLFLNEDGSSIVKSATRETLAAVRQSAHANVTNRKYYDAVCKELFFSDQAVLVEGPDDVHYISNFLELCNSDPLPLVGYGCGGASNIRPWMRLCSELGIRTAALYDGDKIAEFEASLVEFNEQGSNLTSFLLAKNDIRDKYGRDNFGNETNELVSEGVFHRNGQIHEDERVTFDRLVESIRAFLR